MSTSKWRSVSISSDCFCLRATICFCNWENSNLTISSTSLIAVSRTPSIKRRSLNLCVETSGEEKGDIASDLGKRGNKSLTALIASTQEALSSLLSALKCSLFFVPVLTENLLSSELFSLTEHTYTKYSMQIYNFNTLTHHFWMLHFFKHFITFIFSVSISIYYLCSYISLILPTPTCYWLKPNSDSLLIIDKTVTYYPLNNIINH